MIMAGTEKTIDEVRADVDRWVSSGWSLAEMPVSAILFALACHGREANPVGTSDALMAVSDECEDCYGEGSHYDDSHPGNHAEPCVTCGGHGRVPKTSTEGQGA